MQVGDLPFSGASMDRSKIEPLLASLYSRLEAYAPVGLLDGSRHAVLVDFANNGESLSNAAWLVTRYMASKGLSPSVHVVALQRNSSRAPSNLPAEVSWETVAYSSAPLLIQRMASSEYELAASQPKAVLADDSFSLPQSERPESVAFRRQVRAHMAADPELPGCLSSLNEMRTPFERAF